MFLGYYISIFDLAKNSSISRSQSKTEIKIKFFKLFDFDDSDADIEIFRMVRHYIVK